jgi:hypothetical protein
MTERLIEEFQSIKGKPDGSVIVVRLLEGVENNCLADALEALPSDTSAGALSIGTF